MRPSLDPKRPDSNVAAVVSQQDIAKAIRARLDAAREAICRELCAIPPPVPACDVHFNRLLEDRSRIVDAIQRLDMLARDGSGTAGLLVYCRGSVWLDPEFKTEIERALGAALEARTGI